jgi:hypothetical protein
MVPSSRQELVDYCLRALGAPVLEINLDEDQISDRVDEAFQFYQEFHSDAIYKVWHKYQITVEDVENKYIIIPDEITTVQRILPLNSSAGASRGMFSAKYQFMLNDMYNLGFSGNLNYFVQTQQYMGTMDKVLNSLARIRFNRHMNRLYLDISWGDELKTEDYIIVEASRIVDPDTYRDVYNDFFLKKYLTALLKRQWGINLKKFDGMQLPGGVTLNGQTIFDEANQELERLTEDVRNTWELPLDFFID